MRMEVRKTDLATVRFAKTAAALPAPGEVLARVERFAITANNVTYGVVGERIGYWKFFPAEEGWGVIPVWGVGVVEASAHPEVREGERLYGYWPMGSHLTLVPGKVGPARLMDGAAHRAGLPAVYNSYLRLDAEAGYDQATDRARMAALAALRDLLLPRRLAGGEREPRRRAGGDPLRLVEDSDRPRPRDDRRGEPPPPRRRHVGAERRHGRRARAL